MADLEWSSELLERARTSRNWSFHEAGRRLGVGDQCLKNLEKGITDPADVKAGTLLKIIEGYWPDLRLEELVDETPLELMPVDRRRKRELANASTTVRFRRKVQAILRG